MGEKKVISSVERSIKTQTVVCYFWVNKEIQSARWDTFTHAANRKNRWKDDIVLQVPDEYFCLRLAVNKKEKYWSMIKFSAKRKQNLEEETLSVNIY